MIRHKTAAYATYRTLLYRIKRASSRTILTYCIFLYMTTLLCIELLSIIPAVMHRIILKPLVQDMPFISMQLCIVKTTYPAG